MPKCLDCGNTRMFTELSVVTDVVRYDRGLFVHVETTDINPCYEWGNPIECYECDSKNIEGEHRYA